MRKAEEAPTNPGPRPFAQRAQHAVGRLPRGEMNRLEERYCAHLESRKIAGQILWYRFEGVKLRLAEKTFYTPDFAVMTAAYELQMHEVKGGFWEANARTKIKVAAEAYPFLFVSVRWVKPKGAPGAWVFEEF